MGKIFGQFIVLALLFFGVWFLLGKVDYLKRFQVEELTKETERNLGDLILSELQKRGGELDSDSVYSFVNGIKKRLCAANGISDTSITLRILVHDEVNAIALPDRRLVVYTGMIRYCNSPEELSGVMAHEIAHIEHGDVMKGLKKEIGLSMLTALAGGGMQTGKLQGKRQGFSLRSGGIMDELLTAEGKASRIIRTDTPADALRLLSSGQGEYVALALLPGLHILREAGITNVEPVARRVASERYGYAVRKGNQELLSRLEEGLSILKQSGRYQEYPGPLAGGARARGPALADDCEMGDGASRPARPGARCDRALVAFLAPPGGAADRLLGPGGLREAPGAGGAGAAAPPARAGRQDGGPGPARLRGGARGEQPHRPHAPEPRHPGVGLPGRARAPRRARRFGFRRSGSPGSPTRGCARRSRASSRRRPRAAGASAGSLRSSRTSPGGRSRRSRSGST